jgi:lambda family phage portal protein
VKALSIPKRGAPRSISAALGRRPVAVVKRAYAAAQASALLGDWFGTSASANGTTNTQAKSLRRRARELRENSPIVARYAGLCRDNIVGPDGITLQAVVPSTRGTNDADSDRLEARWKEWAKDCTADCRSLVDVLGTIVESWKVEGEALVILDLVDGELSPRVIDPDLLDQGMTEKRRDGSKVVQGVEFDASGRIAAYHIWEASEDDALGGRNRTRWPSESVLYIGHRTRPNQVRGITPLAPVMLLIQHLEKTQEAVVVLNRVTASKMYAVTMTENAVPLTNDDGSPIEPEAEELSPGNGWFLPYGYDVKMLDPGQPTSNYDALITQLLREISSGLNVAYSSLSGNLSDVNYSSIRAGLLVERDGWQMDQVALVNAIVRPLFATWLRIEVLARRVTFASGVLLDDIVCASEFHGRRWAWVDPVKDGEGIEKMIALRMTSRTRELAKQGLDFADIIDELAAEQAYAESHGVDLSTVKGAPAGAPSKPATDPKTTANAPNEPASDPANEQDPMTED